MGNRVGKKNIDLPQISLDKILEWSAQFYEQTCEKFANGSKGILNEQMNEIGDKITWIYMDQENHIYGSGDTKIVPNHRETQLAMQIVEKPLFLFRRSNQYWDTAYFIAERFVNCFLDESNLEKPDQSEYYDNDLGYGKIIQVVAQSGLYNNLIHKFAMGKLNVLCGLDAKNDQHVKGATIADIKIDYSKRIVFISSRNQDEVLLTGAKPRHFGNPNLIAVQRIHKFDDPIIDIIETYNQKCDSLSKKPLLLYGSSKVYDTRVRPKFLPRARWEPTIPGTDGSIAIKC